MQQQKQTNAEVDDECCICLDALPKFDEQQIAHLVCCGKIIHSKCGDTFMDHHQSQNPLAVALGYKKVHCPMCRGTIPLHGSKEHMQLMKKWVKQKKAWAQKMLGDHYREGDGVMQSSVVAVKLYEAAALQGDISAHCSLGFMYAQGVDGAEQSFAKARELLAPAAALGIASAIECIQWMDVSEGLKEGGNFTKKHPNLACQVLKESAAQGNADAQFSLGTLYSIGEGVEQSFSKAREFATKAAAQGHKKAIEFLQVLDQHEEKYKTTNNHSGKETSTGKNDTTEHNNNNTKETVEEDNDCPICIEALPKDALKFSRMLCCGKGMHDRCRNKMAKSKSLSLKQMNTCVLCRTTIADAQHLAQILTWVEKGKPWAQEMLGNRHRDGEEVSRDYNRAAELYQLAADQGHGASMRKLGIYHYKNQRKTVANEWLVKAAQAGDNSAIANLKILDQAAGKSTPSFVPTPRGCAYCGKAHDPPAVVLHACMSCHCVFYCSKQCQKKDWKCLRDGHKEWCKSFNDGGR